jgi:hypothetical protein
MFVPHREHTYVAPRTVTGIALTFVYTGSAYVPFAVRTISTGRSLDTYSRYRHTRMTCSEQLGNAVKHCWSAGRVLVCCIPALVAGYVSGRTIQVPEFTVYISETWNQ